MPAHRASSQNGYRKANACPRMVILTSTIPQPEQVKYSLIKEKSRQLSQMKISQPYMQPSKKYKISQKKKQYTNCAIGHQLFLAQVC